MFQCTPKAVFNLCVICFSQGDLENADDPKNFDCVQKMPMAAGSGNTKNDLSSLAEDDPNAFAAVKHILEARHQYTDDEYGGVGVWMTEGLDKYRVEALYPSIKVKPFTNSGDFFSRADDTVDVRQAWDQLQGYAYTAEVPGYMGINQILKLMYGVLAELRDEQRSSGQVKSLFSKLQSYATRFRTKCADPGTLVASPFCLGRLLPVDQSMSTRQIIRLLDCIMLEQSFTTKDTGYPDWETWMTELLETLTSTLEKLNVSEPEDDEATQSDMAEDDDGAGAGTRVVVQGKSLIEQVWKKYSKESKEVITRLIKDDRKRAEVKQICALLFEGTRQITSAYQYAHLADQCAPERPVSYQVIRRDSWKDICAKDAQLPDIGYAVFCGDGSSDAYAVFLDEVSAESGRANLFTEGVLTVAVYTTLDRAQEVKTAMTKRGVIPVSHFFIQRWSPIDDSADNEDTSHVVIGRFQGISRKATQPRVAFLTASYVRPHSHLSRSDMVEHDTYMGKTVGKESRTVEEFK